MANNWKERYLNMKKLYLKAKRDMIDRFGGAAPDFTLFSQDFNNGELIPEEHAGGGQNVFPKLIWTGAPTETQSFALIIEDPDAPDSEHPGNKRIWTHFVAWDIPKSLKALDADDLTKIKIGWNTDDNNEYYGPYPPIGDPPHHYYFKLYALSKELELDINTTREDLLDAMQGFIIAETETMGLFERKTKD